MTPGAGPVVRSDVVDVYVFRRVAGPGAGASRGARRGGGSGVEFLQLRRASEPLADTWHPVMGHVEAGETAIDCAAREVREELGLRVRRSGRGEGPRGSAAEVVVGFWALEQVHPFYIAAINMIVMSPRFALEVGRGWTPTLNDEHGEYRWVNGIEVERRFMWPGQAAACREILGYIVNPASLARDRLRIS